MSKYILIFLFSFCFSFSQKVRTETFSVFNKQFNYQSIDYSQYGVTLNKFYITCNKQEYDLMFKKAEKCLKEIDRLYHSFYYFLLLPEDVKSQRQKEILVSEFIKQISNKIEYPELNIWILMDEDYSKEYFNEVQLGNVRATENIYIELKANLICNTI